MKNLFISTFLIFFIISCKDDGNQPILPDYIPYSENVAPIAYNYRINISVDKRIELLNVIHRLSKKAVTTQNLNSTHYSNNVLAYFSQFSNHQAVLYIDSLWGQGLSHDAQPTALLYHSDLPAMTQLIPYSAYLLGRAGNEAVIHRMISLMQRFYNDTNFEAFWNDHVNFYIQIENQVKNALSDRDYIQMLEEFYGETKNSYTIIPAPLSGHGYGPQVISEEEEYIYNICGAPALKNNDPNYDNKEYFIGLVFHEFSHSFINPLTEKHNNEIQQSQNLFSPIRDEMKQLNYNNWSICVNEHLVRLSVAILEGYRGGEAKKNEILQREYDRGFIYIYHLNEALSEYINNRATYPTYEVFYPELIEIFNRLANE